MAVAVEPITYGPEGLPALTIGWEALDWCSQNLTNLDGTRWVFTDEQARFVLWWYALDDRGRWLMRRGVLRRMKGWGKDPLAAVMAVCEWLGPCRFGGWRKNGEPIAVKEPQSWVQVAAATASQAEENTMSLFSAIIPKRMQIDEQLSLGVQRCWAPNRRRIQAVSNSSRGIEGARPTFVIKGETQHWVSANGGHRLNQVIDRNVAKSKDGLARSLAITNAHMDGEDSVAELDWKARDQADVLYDSIEAPPDLDPDNPVHILAGIEAARGDSIWLDGERIRDEFDDATTETALNRRFFWNQIVAGSGKWMDPSTWQAAERPQDLPPEGTLITLGFDGSINKDATGLIATVLETGWQWVAGVWEKDHNDPSWEVPREEVYEVADALMQNYKVTRFYADPQWWDESIAKWQAQFERPDGKAVVAAWYTSGGNGLTRTARAVRSFTNALEVGTCTHDRSQVYSRHVLAAHKEILKGRAGEDGLHVIRKSSRASTDTIDLAMAGILSWQACIDSRGDGDLELVFSNPPGVAVPSWME